MTADRLWLSAKGINAATMLNRAQRIGGNAKLQRTTQDLAGQAYLLQIGQKATPRFVHRMAHIIAAHYRLAGHTVLPHVTWVTLHIWLLPQQHQKSGANAPLLAPI